jgi:hypothetical protein
MMSKKAITSEAFRCKYCYQKTYMAVVGSMPQVSPESDGEEWSEPHFVGWSALSCPNCDQINIWYGAVDADGELYVGSEIIYPPSVTYKAPDHIDFQFRAAIEVMRISPAGAVNQFRVILEMIWADHKPGYKPEKEKEKPHLRGKTGSMLSDLFNNQVLSGNYIEMAEVVALIGNLGSHDDAKAKIDYDTAKRAMQLTKAILEHVYQVRPKGLELLRTLIAEFSFSKDHKEKEYKMTDWISGTNWDSKLLDT